MSPAAPESTALPRQRLSQSLVRGLAILSSFGPDRHLLGVNELARELELSGPTTHRYIATLASLGYLQQDRETRKYRLGPRVLDLGFTALSSMDLRQVAAPHLQRLSDETGYTANLAILDGHDVVYIERCRTSRPGQRDIDLNLHVGSRLPVYCTAMGKAMLAFVDDERREAVLAGVEFLQRGPNTLTDRASLERELERIRGQGIAVNNEELAFGLRSIAAPILSQSGVVAGALNLAVHRSMVSTEELVTRYGPTVQRTASEVSSRIGR